MREPTPARRGRQSDARRRRPADPGQGQGEALEAADQVAARLVELLDSDKETWPSAPLLPWLDCAGHETTSTHANVDAGSVNYTIEGADMEQL